MAMTTKVKVREIERWGFFEDIGLTLLSFIFPIVGLGLGLYGLTHYGKRLNGLFMLGFAGLGFICMPFIWLILWAL